MIISIKEIDNAIHDIFNNYEALDVETTYEKEKDSLKLIIVFKKLYHESLNVLYTKLIFLVDNEKVNLKRNSFLYLYDINCIYRKVNFEDVDDFKKKISKIFKEEKFGEDIKILSKFMEYPSTMINNWLYNKNITNINVKNVRYSPKTDIIPCKYLSFDFKMDVNNIEIQVFITKDGKEDYRYEFLFPENVYRKYKNNLKDLVETIGVSLKNNF